VAAAALMGIDQPKVSALLNGRLASFSTDCLLRLLTALGQDIEIVVRERPSSLEKGRISVIGGLEPEGALPPVHNTRRTPGHMVS
jgi:Helix-turn-helix domain